MFVAEGVQADAEFREQHEIDSVIATLEEQEYRPVLRSMLAAACDIVSVPKTAIRVDLLTERRGLYRRPEPRAGLPGDLLFKDDLAFVLQPMGHRLHIWQIRHHGHPSGLGCLCSTLESAVKSRLDGRRVRGMNFSWKPIKKRRRHYLPAGRFYQEAKLETKLAEYTQEESDAAKLFVSPDVRSFMIRLAQVGKARASDAVSDAGTLSIDDLLTLQLIRKEYLVLCRKDSHTICAIQDHSEIETGSASLFACPVCGRSFRDELIQDIYALTESGKKLLLGSRWMTIWITDLLVTVGVPKEDVAWNATASEDELDLMVDVLGPRVFFELKDREFGLGDAYPFSYRVSRYGGAFGVVVTTDKVAGEAKKFFDEQRPNMRVQIIYLEGQGTIEQEVKNLIDQVSRNGVMLLLSELAESLPLDLIPVMNAWMHRVAENATAPDRILQLKSQSVVAEL